MKSTKFIALLITPSIDRGYIHTLSTRLPTLEVDWIMYRSQSDEYIPSFVETLSHKTLLLNLPFTNLKQILSLSTPFQGVHLKSHLLDYIAPLKKAYEQINKTQKLIGYSAHSIKELTYAFELGADYCTLSPIFFTPNKPAPLGLQVLEDIPQNLRSRTIALGGIAKEHIPHLQALGLGGFAGISYFES